MNEITFASLKHNFDEICDQVNDGNETLTLTLKNNRKVFIMPEESYDKIETFFVSSISNPSLVFHS